MYLSFLEDSSVPKKLKTAPEIDMDDSSNQVSQLNKELPVGKVVFLLFHDFSFMS